MHYGSDCNSSTAEEEGQKELTAVEQSLTAEAELISSLNLSPLRVAALALLVVSLLL